MLGLDHKFCKSYCYAQEMSQILQNVIAFYRTFPEGNVGRALSDIMNRLSVFHFRSLCRLQFPPKSEMVMVIAETLTLTLTMAMRIYRDIWFDL